MKKFLSTLLCLSFINMLGIPAFAEITDDFVEKTLSKNLKIKAVKQNKITDSFVEQTLDKNLQVKKVTPKLVEDSFAEKNTNKNYQNNKIIELNEMIPELKDGKPIRKVVFLLDKDEMQAVPVRIKKYYTTRSKLQEGDFLEFETTQNVVIKNINYPKGTTVTARIETISLNKSMGVPSDLVIGNFSINGTPIIGEIAKTGANRSLWVYPSVYGLSLFFGIGLLFIPIRGGHAKITRHKIYTFYAKKD